MRTMKKLTPIIIISALAILILIIGGIFLFSRTPSQIAVPSLPTTRVVMPSFQQSLLGDYPSCSDSDVSCGGECTNCQGGGFICCEVSGWKLVPSGDCDTGECQPTAQDCSSDPTKSLDCSFYCNNGWIHDHGANSCCPPTEPYYIGVSGGQGRCGAYPNTFSDNYYTRHSDCPAYKNNLYAGQTTCGRCGGATGNEVGCQSMGCPANPQDFSWAKRDCDGTNYKVCTEKSNFIFRMETKGIVKGQCEVDCLSSEEKCEGIIYSLCGADYKWQDKGEQIGKCGVDCQTGVKEYQTCSDGFVSDKFIKRSCEFGKWVQKDESCTCIDNSVCIEGYECKNSVCVKKSEWFQYILIGGAVIIILGLGTFIILKLVKKRR